MTIKEASLFCKDGDWIESKDQSPSGIRLIQTGNIGIGTYLDKFNRAKYISEETFDRMECTEVFPGDIIISRLPAPVGRACIVPDGLGRTIAAVDCTILRIDEKKFLKEYILLYSETEQYKAQIEKFLAGSTRVRISRKNLESISIPQKNLETQKSIVSRIYKIKNIIDLREQQLAKLDQLVKSRFIEIFGDPVKNPYHWTISRLEHSIKFITSGSRGWSQYFSNDGELFITIKNVKNSKIIFNEVQYIHPPKNAEAARTKVQEDDLLISITADLGRTGVVTKFIAEKGAYINQHLTCIRLDKSKLLPVFVSYFLESPSGKKQFSQKNQTGVKAGLNFDAIKSLQIFTPPLSLQEQFVAFVQQVDKEKSSVEQSLEKLETLKKSLMQEYFG